VAVQFSSIPSTEIFDITVRSIPALSTTLADDGRMPMEPMRFGLVRLQVA
jgi:hypothetical protein